MKIEMPPEFIPSEEVYNIIIEEIKKVAGKDSEKIMRDLYRENPTEEKFLRTLALSMRRYLPVSRINRALTNIRERIANLVKVSLNKHEIVIPKNGKDYLKVRVDNNIGAPVRFRVILSQPQKRTAIIYDPKQSATFTKLAKIMIIESGKGHTFNFMIKPDIYMIEDVYALKKKNEIKIPITVKVDANYDLIKLPSDKVNVIIKRIM